MKCKFRGHQPAAAVNIIAHTAGRHDTGFQIKSRHATNGKTIAPVNIRHGQRIIYYTRQVRHISHLLGTFIVFQQIKYFLISVDNPRHAHSACPGQQPAVIIKFFQFDLGHQKSPALLTLHVIPDKRSAIRNPAFYSFRL